jgi:parvulin-like peptidyl-prolyl isomerase
VDADLQGILSRRAVALSLVALLAACGGPRRQAAAPRAKPLPEAAPVVQPPPRPPEVSDYGPEILLPSDTAPDAEVARIGDTSLRQSQAFARLLSADPKLALSAVDLLVFDVLIARHAREFAIRVPNERVRALAEDEERRLREQVELELGAKVSFQDYVWRIFGMRLEDWRRTSELRTAQRLYQGYVIRYLALREDRVVVRYIANKDEKALFDAAEKVRQGADFATLALRLSDDPLRREGGLLPAFSAQFPHPVTKVAIRMQPGALSDVFEQTAGDERRFYLVYCLDRLPGRDVAFADVQQEVDQDLEKRPLTPIETNAYTLRWRGALEGKSTDEKQDAPR